MTDDRELSLILDRWLADGPTEMPDRVVDVIATGISRQRQRPAWRLDWRQFTMNPLAKVGAAIAAVVLVALVGYNLLPGPSTGVGGPAATPTPSVTPSATLTPSPTPSGTPKPTRMEVQGDSARWTALVPAGWTGGGSSRITASQGHGGPTGISVGASGAVNVPSDPCDGSGKHSDAASPADVVAELEARDDLVVSDPIDTTLGGYAGLRVDVRFPADLSACSADSYFLFAEPDGSGIPALGPSNLFRIWILDVEGRPIVFWIESFDGTSADDMAEAQQFVDSIVIAP